MPNNTIQKSYALVTGASLGLGKAFARNLAKRDINIILVSLPGEGLTTLCEELKNSGVDAVPYETDLTKKENILALTQWVNSSYNINILVNNAGIGGNSHFLEADIGFLESMVQLNVMATTLIIHQLLPNLLKQQDAYVLNVSSLAALSPIAYKAVYPASKAFIHSFTRGLQQEYSKTQVVFSVLNPGPMKTNGNVSKRIESQGFWVKLSLLSPEKIAHLSLDGLFQGKHFIKLNWVHRLSLALLNLLPTRIKSAILSKIARKEVNNNPAYESLRNRG